MEREMMQETGYEFQKELLSYFGKVFVRYDDYDFIYHIFSAKVHRRPYICINPGGHKNFAWASPVESLKMNLMQDLDACIKLFYRLV